MSRWRIALEWVVTIGLVVIASIGVILLVNGEMVEGKMGAAGTIIGFLIAAALVCPIFWRRAGKPQYLLMRYGVAALLVVGTVSFLPPSTVVIHVPETAGVLK